MFFLLTYEKISLEILMELHIFSPSQIQKSVFGMPSIYMHTRDVH
jgi:hypothetical protein